MIRYNAVEEQSNKASTMPRPRLAPIPAMPPFVAKSLLLSKRLFCAAQNESVSYEEKKVIMNVELIGA
jgi:hypothetical protein